MTIPFLRLEGVSKRYRERPAVDGVSLEITFGESVVVVGPSGSGKTTLLRLIAGLSRPDAGEIWLGGQKVSGPGVFVPAYDRRLGFVFQDLALWPHLSIRESLDFVLRAARTPRVERRSRADSALGLARIAELSERYPHELSGGEQQRAAIARALVGRPRLLLLDEPLSSLDPNLRSVLRQELRELARELGLTSIYVTHDQEDAAVLADRVLEMREGRLS